MMAEGKPERSRAGAARAVPRQGAGRGVRRAVLPPVSDGSGQDRALLRKASQLLQRGRLRRSRTASASTPKGEPVTIEFLIDEPTFQPHHMPFIKNLATLGIEATLRIVDPVQFRKRVDEFDFDITVAALQLLADAGRLAALLLLARSRRAMPGLVQSRRHRRSGGRRADREDHRGRDARPSSPSPAARSTA